MARHHAHTPEYDEYLKSPEWRKRSEAAKKRAGNRCRICNRHQSEVPLQAHHRTYERLGHEDPDDLTVLCKDCHTLFHKSGRLATPPYWATAPAQASSGLPSAYMPTTTSAVAPRKTTSGLSRGQMAPTTQDRWLGFAIVSAIVFLVIFLAWAIPPLGATSPPTTEPAKQQPTSTVQRQSRDNGAAVVIAGDPDTDTPTPASASTPMKSSSPTDIPATTNTPVTNLLLCTVTADSVPHMGPGAHYSPARPITKGEGVIVTGYSDACNTDSPPWYRLSSGRWLPSSLVDCPTVSDLRQLDIECTLPPTPPPG